MDLFIILSGIAIAWLLPIFIIITSDEVTASEKFAWVFAVVFVSWFAWIFYFLLAPIKKKE